MKKIRLITGFVFLLVMFSSITAFKTNGINKLTEIEDGTYYIVNVETGDALTPVGAGVNENAYLKDFKKSGMQKWNIKKRTANGKNGKQVVSYTFQHAASGFYLRPYFVPDNHSAIIGAKENYSNFTIVQDEGNYIIKNNQMGGDALYAKGNESWFANDEATDKFRWEIINADGGNTAEAAIE